MSGSQSNAPLIFVYLGSQLPEYTNPSLRFALRDTQRRVILLGTSADPPGVSKVEYYDVSEWYSPLDFERFRSNSPLDPYFRNGFWFRAAERFFVLQQWVKREKIDTFFHAELDNLIFTLSSLENSLSHERGKLFLPADSIGRGFGSLVYCSGFEALDALVAFMIEHADMGNEMLILGHFLARNPELASRLPSIESGVVSHSRHEPVGNSEEVAGLVDAAALGQWLFGIDPSNTSRTVFTKRRNESSHVDLRGLSFQYRETDHTLLVKHSRRKSHPVFNLHVHSKIIGRLEKNLRIYLWAAKFPFPVVVVYRAGRLRHHITRRILSKKNLRFTRTLIRLVPVSARVLNFLAVNSYAQLSKRERKELRELRGSSAKKERRRRLDSAHAHF